MKIVICGSIDFTYEIKDLADQLRALGREPEIPLTSKRILGGELTLEQFKQEKQAKGDASFRKIKDDVIRKYYGLIKDSDAILVANCPKKGVDGYIGGNTFLEMGFAHVLGKQIYLLHPVPAMSYQDEMEAMRPTVLEGDVAQLAALDR